MPRAPRHLTTHQVIYPTGSPTRKGSAMTPVLLVGKLRHRRGTQLAQEKAHVRQVHTWVGCAAAGSDGRVRSTGDTGPGWSPSLSFRGVWTQWQAAELGPELPPRPRCLGGLQDPFKTCPDSAWAPIQQQPCCSQAPGLITPVRRSRRPHACDGRAGLVHAEA